MPAYGVPSVPEPMNAHKRVNEAAKKNNAPLPSSSHRRQHRTREETALKMNTVRRCRDNLRTVFQAIIPI